MSGKSNDLYLVNDWTRRPRFGLTGAALVFGALLLAAQPVLAVSGICSDDPSKNCTDDADCVAGICIISGICDLDPTNGCEADGDCGVGETCLLPTVGGDLIPAAGNDVDPNTPGDQGCMNDVYQAFGQGGDLNCTANDVNIAATHDLVIIDECEFPGDTATISFVAQFDLTAQARHDVGVYIASDGGDALYGSCAIANFPIEPDPPWLDLDALPGTCSGRSTLGCTNVGSSTNSECWDVDGGGNTTCDADPEGQTCSAGSDNPGASCTNNNQCTNGTCELPSQLTCSNARTVVCTVVGDCNFGTCDLPPFSGDTCGDIDTNHDPLYHQLDGIILECIDADGDGDLDANACLSWRQPGANEFCDSPLGAFPGAPSKCKCQTIPGITVPVPGQLSAIDKVTLDANGDPLPGDPTLFDFTLDGPDDDLPDNFQLADATPPYESPFLDPSVCGPDGFCLNDSEMTCTADADCPTYDLTEAAEPGWELVSAVCVSDQGSPDQDLVASGGVLTVANGESLSCTFTNKQQFLPDPELTLEKSTTTTTYAAVGDLIDYSYSVTNTGNVTLAGPVTISDDKTTATCADLTTIGDLDGDLDVDETVICTAVDYVVTQADIDAGSVTNLATASADGTDSNQDSVTVNATQTPELTLEKSTTTTTYAAVGDLIDYSYSVTNTGNVTLAEPVTIADNKTTATCALSGDGDLDVDETVICTAVDYVVTQADIDAGSVTNLATASADGTDSNQDSVTVNATQTPELTLEKSTTTTTYAAVGDLIDYSYSVTNTGNVTLAEPVTIADNKTTATCALSGDGDLDVDETVICTAVDYVVTQADIDAGSVTNLATASADGTDSNQDSVTVNATQTPELTLEKSTTTTTYAAVGDLIDYSYSVTNTGNVTLAEPVTIADNKTTATCALSGDGDLDVDETVICTAVDYVVTQADIDAGSVTNLATASADGTDSNQDSVTVNATQTPELTLEKSTTTTTYAAVGDLIDYSYSVTNTGNVTLAEPVTIADNKTTATCALSGDGDLDVDETVICTAVDYVVTQADIDAGSVTNLATASADGTDSNQDSVTVNATQTPELTLEKSTTTTTYAAVGDLIDYSYSVTNTGNVTLAEPVTIADNKTTATCALSGDGDLDVDETVICTAVDYVVTQADIDAGSVTNLATASADGTDSNQDSVTVNATQTPELTLEKSTTTTTYAAVGDLIDYSYSVTNTGNVTLAEPVTIADNKTTATCALSGDGDLDVDETVICTAVDYVVTQADIDAGSVTNLATASADGTDSNQDSVTVNATQTPELTLEKSTTTTTYAAVGDLIDYSYSVTNTGNVTLAEPVTIADNKTTATCALSGDGDLDVDETVICTAVDYVVTQADIDAGSVTNLATASADGTDSNQDSVTVNATQTPELTLEKSTTTTTYAAVGDLIDYSYSVTNTGNVTLAEPVTIADNKTTATCALSGDGDLDVDETVICTAVDYVVTQADIDAGSVTNLATASADGTDSNQDSVTVNATQTPELTLEKSTTTTTYAAVGDLIDYSYSVTNTGNVTLAEPVTIADNKTTATCALSGDGDLDVDETVICTAVDYVVTQADIDAGSVTNLATASADGTDSNQDSVTVNATQTPELTLEKSTTTTTYAAVGDLIDYSYSVTNTGNVTLAEPVTIADNKTTATCALSGDGDLDVDETVICTAVDYVVTQADIDAGSVTNLATASADGTDSNQDSVTVNATQTPELTLEKSTTTTTYAAVGDLIDYSYSVTNTGNVTLAEPVTIADNKTTATCALSGDGDLDVDETVICTAVDYVVTQADIDAGSVTNLATASADGTDSNQDSVTVNATQTPELTLEKSTTTTTYAAVGDLIDYSYSVTNTGNVTLAEPVTIADNKTTATCALSGDGDLDVDETVICTAVDYVVTQADIDAGSVTNLATASADGTDSNQDSVTVNATQTPELTLEKSTTTTTYAAVGDLIDYSYSVTNTGNVTLAEPVTIADNKTTATCALSGDGDLDVDETVICTAVDYVVTQADIDAGSVTNLATASADGTDSNQDSVTVNATQTPELTLEKSTTTTTYAAVGDLIDYSYSVTNTGNVTLAEPVTIADNKTTATCALSGDGDLDVDETVICTAVDYVVTQADIDAGSVTNLATASADGTDSNQDSVTVNATQDPAIQVVKSSDAEFVNTGDMVTYFYDVTNIGNVTLTNVTIADPHAGLSAITCTPAQGSTLAPNGTMSCSATYTVTQADIDAGTIVNTGTASGTDPNGDDDVTDDGTLVLDDELVQDPAITIEKSPDLQQVVLGGEASFIITVTNSGNLTLFNVSVSDPIAPLCEFDIPELAVGDSVQHNCTLLVTDDLTNVATVTATGPQGQEVGDSDDAGVDALPQIDVTKSTTSAGIPPTGGYVEFTIQVTNLSGANDPVTITSIVDDPYGNILDPGNTTIVGTDCAAVVIAPAATYSCGFTVYLPGGEIDDVFADEVTVTGTDDEGNGASDSDTAEVTVKQGPGVGTPGFWKNHPEVWNGDTQDDVLQPDVLYPVDSNGDGAVDGQDSAGILIGDWNMNGICDAFESCIFHTLEEAYYILDASSQLQGHDKRFTLGRALIAAWLNIIGCNDSTCIEGSVNAGVDWLKDWTGDRGPDARGDGRIVTIDDEGNVEIDGDKVKGRAWSQEGEPIYLALDCYNNTGGGCAIDRDTGEIGGCGAYTNMNLEEETISWSMPPVMDGALVKLVRGQMSTLRSTAGDFTLATTECLADDYSGTDLVDEDRPPPGEGYWYLVGSIDYAGDAMFDYPAPSQVGLRNEEIENSSATCN